MAFAIVVICILILALFTYAGLFIYRKNILANIYKELSYKSDNNDKTTSTSDENTSKPQKEDETQ